MEPFGGFSVRSILRAIFAIALLLGGGGGDWTVAKSQTHESCCCGTPAGVADSCPCPKPEGNRGSSRSSCSNSPVVVASATVRRSQGQRRIEPRPEPTGWASRSMDANASSLDTHPPVGGRDPDLGRHLARLSTFRI